MSTLYQQSARRLPTRPHPETSASPPARHNPKMILQSPAKTSSQPLIAEIACMNALGPEMTQIGLWPCHPDSSFARRGQPCDMTSTQIEQVELAVVALGKR